MKLIKFSYFLISICVMQVVFSDNLHFYFYYGENITSVTFNHVPNSDEPYNGNYMTATGDKLSVSTANVNKGYEVAVTTDIDNKQKNAIPTQNVAESYNSIFIHSTGGSNIYHLMQLTSNGSGSSSNLDFWVQGALYINNELVASDFTLGHNNEEYTTNLNWWIASNYATIYQPGLSLDLQNIDGSHHYCIRPYNQQSDYQVAVSAGTCSSNNAEPFNWTDDKNEDIIFKYSTGVQSVVFGYNGVYDATHNGVDYLKNVSQTSNSNQLTVTITAKIDNDSSIAGSYNTMFNWDHSINVKGDVKSPSSLAFWLQGGLTINGEFITSDFTIAQHADKDWYVGTNNGDVIISNMLTVTANTSGNKYCLTGINKNTISVASGECTGSGKQSEYLNFIYESGIESVNFQYNNYYYVKQNKGNVFDVTETIFSNSGDNGISVIVDEDASLSSSVSNSYNNIFKKGNSMSIDTATYYYSVPTKMKYYIEGTLFINGSPVATDFTITSEQNGRVIGSNYGTANQIFDPNKGNYNQNYMDFTTLDGTNQHYCLLSLSKGSAAEYFARAWYSDKENVWVYAGTCASIGYIN